MIGWLVGGLLLTLGVAAAILWPKWRRRSLAERLHQQLAEASELTADESDWLWRRATAPGVSDPALVFLSPTLLDAVAGSDVERARAVRAKLFGI